MNATSAERGESGDPVNPPAAPHLGAESDSAVESESAVAVLDDESSHGGQDPGQSRAATLAGYEEDRAAWAAFTDWVVGYLEDDFKSQGIDVAWIEGRAKSLSSYAAKLLYGEAFSIDPLNDFAGIRVVTYVQADKSVVEARLRDLLGVSSLDITKLSERVEHLEAWEFAYRTFQFTARVPSDRLPPEVKFGDTTFEVQIRTVCEHAWAALDHKLRYKTTVPLDSKGLRILFRTAALLENVDNDFEELYSQVTERVGDGGLRVMRRDLTGPLGSQAVRGLIKADEDIIRGLLAAADAGWTFHDPDLYLTAEERSNPEKTDAEVAALDLCVVAQGAGLGTVFELKSALVTALSNPELARQIQVTFRDLNLAPASCVADYLAMVLIVTNGLEPLAAYRTWRPALTSLQEHVATTGDDQSAENGVRGGDTASGEGSSGEGSSGEGSQVEQTSTDVAGTDADDNDGAHAQTARAEAGDR